MSKQPKDIPVFTTGGPGQKSIKVDAPQGPFFSSYTGLKISDILPTIGSVDPTSGKILHGGIQVQGGVMLHNPGVPSTQ